VRIALHPVYGPGDDSRFAPLVCGSLAAYLHELEFDATVTVEPDFESLFAVQPDVIAITCTSLAYGVARQLAQDLKDRCRARLILFGPHITALPETLAPIFHVGIVGEVEDTFHHVVSVLANLGDLAPEHLESVPGIVYFDRRELRETGPRQPVAIADHLPPPEHELLGKPVYAHLMTGRGNPFDTVPSVRGESWGLYRPLPAEHIAAQIAAWIDAGHTRLYIVDEDFAVDPASVVRLADVLEDDERLGLAQIVCALRPERVNDDLAEVLVRLNVVAVTFDLSPGPDFDPADPNPDWPGFNKALELLERFEIAVAVRAVIGLPGQTIEAIQTLYEHLSNAVVAGRVDQVNVRFAGPMPGTPLWLLAVERGLIGDLTDFDWARLAEPWRDLLLSDVMLAEAGRIVAWDRHLRRLVLALRRPLILLAPDDVDLELDVDPHMLRAIFLLADEPGLSEVLADGEIDLVRFGPDTLRATLSKIVAEQGNAPLIMVAPDPAGIDSEMLRAAKLGITFPGHARVAPGVDDFPQAAVLAHVLDLDNTHLAEFVSGDLFAWPGEPPRVSAEEFIDLPLTDLSRPVAHEGTATELLAKYQAALRRTAEE
jgi:radical SAM superfamily enzyme YgiQ (UPF0313 family)